MAHKHMKKIKAALTNTGLPWELKLATKHWRITLGGRQIAVFSQGSKGFRGPSGETVILHTIRKAARELHGQAV